jgi:alkyl hydroperoxide reductase subunit AhpF
MDCKEKPVAYCKYCGVPLYSGNSIYRCALYYFNVGKEELD